MILPHPLIKNTPAVQTINSIYGSYPACFVALHPFILTKPGHEHLITFDDYNNRPQKFEILQHCVPMTWTHFISASGVRDISSLARCIIFMERGRRLVERSEYLKMCSVLDSNPEIMTPPVDWIPELWENDLGNYMLAKAHPYLDIAGAGEESRTIETASLLGKQSVFKGAFSRIVTAGGTITLDQNADEPYTFILGEREAITELVNSIHLEGFFTNDNTPMAWSDIEIRDEEQMDWDEDMRRIGK